MTPREIIDASLAPGTKSVFFLGNFEPRVTLYAQQVRAINLVDALLAENVVRKTGRVAVVGGGVAGVTAASALAVAASTLNAVDIYERKDELLHLQQLSRDRYVHPHLYDWPQPGSDRTDAGLPLLNWHAATAGEVATTILDSFESIKRQTGIINLKRSREVESLLPAPNGPACRVFVKGDPKDRSEIYDAVILAIGFGYESFLSESNHSYWTPSVLSGPIRAVGEGHVIFVSGNGDGGLVDFMMAAYNHLSHQELSDFIVRHADLDEVQRRLLSIEDQAWSTGTSVDIFAEYKRLVAPVLPQHMLLEVSERLRPDVQLVFHTREPMLFKRDTAILNRFGAFLAIVADETFGLGRVRLSIGKEFVAGPPLSGEIAIVGEAPFTPYLRFLRLGPEGEKNLLPFRDLADAFRRTLTMTDGFRPATPPFSDSATDRFAALIVPPSPPPRIQSIVAPSSGAGGRVALQIERRADGLFVWSGDLTLDAVGAAWNDEVALLEVTCSAVPSDSGAIVAALGRLCGHATRCELHCRDRRRWEEAMQPFTGRALPGPNIDWHFSIVDVGERRIEANAPGYSSDAIAEQLSARLDARVLCDLHHVLSACLRQDQAVDIGWLIEPTLKAQMSARWLTWHAELEQDAAKLRRFLVLLATHRDEIRQSADALVSVGPKTMRPHLVRAIVFALAFAVSSDETFSPTVDYPGNMRAPSATAHASGISWIDGRDIGPEVSTLRWSASVVLLSELRTSLEFLQRHDVRLDRLLEDAPHISDQGTAEQPFIFGCDHVFRNALEHGIDAVRLLIQAALRDRAATVEKQIEPKGKHDGQDVQ